MPIRFFCKRCSLMMKIGEPMAGQTVYCPQCNEPLLVPPQSDPKAEDLFQYMKKKRTDNKAAQIVDSFDTAEADGRPQATDGRRQTTDGSIVPPIPVTSGEAGNDKEIVDRWIDQFWTSIPETKEEERRGEERGESDEGRETTDKKQGTKDEVSSPHPSSHAPHTVPPAPHPYLLISSPSPVVPSTPETAALVVRRQQTLMLFRVWLFTVFLVGFTLGFLFHSAFFKSSGGFGAAPGGAAAGESCVTGTLYYRNFGGEREPDADAVVLFLPLERTPPFPMVNEGLRPEDSGNPAANEGLLQVEELEGLFVRAGADGSFTVPYRNAGKYVALFVSSHSRRSEQEAEPDPITLQKLKKYFKDPKGLLGDYGFIRDEYEFTEGRYVLQLTFP